MENPWISPAYLHIFHGFLRFFNMGIYVFRESFHVFEHGYIYIKNVMAKFIKM